MSINVQETVLIVISEIYSVEPQSIRFDRTMEAQFKGDSLDYIELILSLEEALKVELHDEMLDKLTTVQTLIDYATQVVDAQ
jgi:acyl carrier protein